MFNNREQAGNLLATKLISFSNNKNVVIVTIPRGGVPVGYQIATKLNIPLEIVLSKKIGHPFNKEFAIGAVTLKSSILSDAVNGVSKKYIEQETQRVRTILKQRYKWYYGDKKPINFKNKTIIIVDDGIATGNTLISSIELIHQQNPLKIIVALPVAPTAAFKKIKSLPTVETAICLHVSNSFNAVGQFYEDFTQVTDSQVIELLKKANDNFQIKKAALD